MVVGLLGAFGASLCYGVASILQAVAARRAETVDGLDPRLVLRLARSWQYVLGLALDGVAFLLTIAALRTLPLFAVQSIVASFLAVTAVLGALVLHLRLTRSDRVAVGVVVTGLALVGASAAAERPVAPTSAELWATLVAAAVLAVLAIPLGRLTGTVGAAWLGTIAGLGFGVVAIAARMLPERLTVGGLLTSPATWALVVAGGVALLGYATALQRGSVTVATAPLVIAETVLPAAIGVWLLGDTTRPGWGGFAVVGVVLSVAGAVALARHGEVEAPGAAHPTGPAG